MHLKDYEYITWRRLARRVVKEIREDDVLGRAAQLAYFLLFSLFPILLIVIVILGYLAQGAEMRENLLDYFRRAVPESSFALVRNTLTQITTHAGGGKLSIGIVATLWAASSGMTSIIDGLNKAYEVEEARPWWKARLLAVALTIGLTVMVVAALVILLYGPGFGGLLANWLGLGSMFETIWAILRWPLVFCFAFSAFLLVYRFAPNLHDQHWSWILPGAAAGVCLWFLVSFALRIYLHYFNAYSTVYGSLGAVLILLLWLYLSSAALLIGGELNSEIENAAARGGAPDAKRAGEKAPHQRA